MRCRGGAGSGGGGGGGGGGGVDGFDDFKKLGLNLFNLLFKGTLTSFDTYCLEAFFLPKLKPVFLDDESKVGLALFLLIGAHCLVGETTCLEGVELLLGTASLLCVVLELLFGLGTMGTVLESAGGCFEVGDFLMRSNTFFGGKALALVSLKEK